MPKIKTKLHRGREYFFYRFSYFILTWFCLNIFLVSGIFAAVEIKSEPFPSRVLPKNAINMPLLKIKIKTDNQPIYIKSITVAQKGLSDRSDFEGILAQADFVRSYTARFNNDGEAKLRFRSPVLIPIHRESTIDILVHLNSRLGRTLGVDLVSVDWSLEKATAKTLGRVSPRFKRGRYILSTGQQKWAQNRSYYKGFRRSTPRNTFRNYSTNRVSSYEVPKITYQALGGGNQTSLRWGRYNRVHRFRLKNTGKKSVYLNSIRFKNRGTADLDEVFDRLEVRDKYNRVIAETETIDRKYVDFLFENVLISRAQSQNFSVWGKMVGGRKNETIQLFLEEENDLLTSGVSRMASRPDLQSTISEDESHNPKIPEVSPILSEVSGNLSISSSRNNSVGTRKYNPGSRDIVFLSQNIRPPTAIYFEKVHVFVSPFSVISDKNKNGVKNEIEDFEATFEDLTLFVDQQYADQNPEIKLDNRGNLFLEFEAPTEMRQTQNFLVTGRLSRAAQNGDRIKLFLDRKKSFPDWKILR